MTHLLSYRGLRRVSAGLGGDMDDIDFSRQQCFPGQLRDLHDNKSQQARKDRRPRPDGRSTDMVPFGVRLEEMMSAD